MALAFNRTSNKSRHFKWQKQAQAACQQPPKPTKKAWRSTANASSPRPLLRLLLPLRLHSPLQLLPRSRLQLQPPETLPWQMQRYVMLQFHIIVRLLLYPTWLNSTSQQSPAPLPPSTNSTPAPQRTATPTRTANGSVNAEFTAPMPSKAVPHGAPARRYLNEKVTGVLLEGMKRLAAEQYVSLYYQKRKGTLCHRRSWLTGQTQTGRSFTSVGRVSAAKE